MISTTKIEMDVSRNIGKFVPCIDVVQDDRYSRNIEITVLSNGSPLSLDGTRALIRYVKADGTGGNYDTLPDGSSAFTISGNVLTVALAPQVCTAVGIVKMVVAIISEEAYLHTFPLKIQVHRNPGLEVVSEDYLKMIGAVSDSGWPADMYLGTDQDGNVVAKAVSTDCVSYAPQSLTPAQQSRARANIDALKIPRKIVRELFAFVEYDDGFQEAGNLNVYKFPEMLNWLHSPEDFDFRIRFSVRTSIATVEEYEFTKADCRIEATAPGGRWSFYAATSISAVTRVLTVANGISLVGSDSENNCSLAYPSEFEDFSIELYRIENTERELKVVTSVNGVEADENGNVTVPQRSDAEITQLIVDQTEERFTGVEKDIADILAEIHYQNIDITAFSCSGAGVYEIGKSVEAPDVTWSLNKTPAKQTLNGETLDVDARSKVYAGNITANKTYTLVVTGAKGETDSASASFTFYNGVYYGVGNDDATTEEIMAGLTKELRSDRKKTFTATAGKNQRHAFAIPSRYGTPTFKDVETGFQAGFDLSDTFQFTNSSGYTEEYKLWLSSNMELGSMTIAVS